MALRIGQSKGLGQSQAASQPAMLMEEPAEMPMEEQAAPVAEMMDESEPRLELAKASQEAARYLLPEYRCGSCVHYLDAGGTGTCEIVAGEIHAEGSCSLYEPDADMLAPEAPEAPVTEGLEAPVEPEPEVEEEE